MMTEEKVDHFAAPDTEFECSMFTPWSRAEFPLPTMECVDYRTTTGKCINNESPQLGKRCPANGYPRRSD